MAAVNNLMAVEEVVNNNNNLEAMTTNTAVEVNSPMAVGEVVNSNLMAEETIPTKEAKIMIRIKVERNTLTVVITKALDTVPSLSLFPFIPLPIISLIIA